ncbi:Bax inhibitor-1 family protein [Candidatus Peregrinibacteria bacterium]|nr:MAG: Bax inhibitor-1 family protein [Candidatus Peregrinibacteria bacterium]
MVQNRTAQLSTFCRFHFHQWSDFGTPHPFFCHRIPGYDLIYSSLFSATATFGAAALLGYTTQKSLAGFSGFLFMSLIGLLVVSIGGIFFPWGNTTEMIVSGFGVLLFAGYAAVDMNRLRDYPEDEYINAAIALYLDFFNLFIYILRFTSALSRD